MYDPQNMFLDLEAATDDCSEDEIEEQEADFLTGMYMWCCLNFVSSRIYIY